MKDRYKLKKKIPLFLIGFLFLTTFLTFRTFKKVNSQDILIFGSELFSIEDIVSNTSIDFPTPLIFVRTKFIEKELKNNLSLENVSVYRQLYPFGLKILIKTRTPVAYGERFLDGKKITGFIDEGGFFINEKYADKENLKILSTKIFGWKENFREISSKILRTQKNNDVQFNSINFSPNGFLTLEEKSLKTIFLGIDPKIIETQLQIICDIENQLKGTNILKRLDNIDLTDPKNPKIKVFKS